MKSLVYWETMFEGYHKEMVVLARLVNSRVPPKAPWVRARTGDVRQRAFEFWLRRLKEYQTIERKRSKLAARLVYIEERIRVLRLRTYYDRLRSGPDF